MILAAFRWRRLALLLAGPLLLSACDDKASTMTLPDPPAPLTRPAEYSFGDHVAAADERLAKRAGVALGNPGRPREVHYVAPAGTDFDAIRQSYAARARDGGWAEARTLALTLRPGEGGFGFTRGDQAFALVWLRAEAGGATPVTVIRVG
ncbi:hypothetical protein [Glacieibacterium sp.]|uniref:hypothetical protein n=1 Tax=Glacieibacterium sp. TaxID=2860237 RepID=UPI003B00E499